jgi:hypothetical protein
MWGRHPSVSFEFLGIQGEDRSTLEHGVYEHLILSLHLDKRGKKKHLSVSILDESKEAAQTGAQIVAQVGGKFNNPRHHAV